MTTATPAAPVRIEKLLLKVAEVAHVLGISRAEVYELRRAGLIPYSIDIGGNVRWRADELRAFVDAGCPSLSSWVWTPSIVGKLDDVIAHRRRELRELMDEIAVLEVRRTQGERVVAVCR